MKRQSTYRFDRAKILPLFLQRQETIAALARRAGCNPATASRAVNGEKIYSAHVDKIARALNFNAVDFLAEPAQAYSE